MFKCSICGKEFKSLSGLLGHKQFKHPGNSKRVAGSGYEQIAGSSSKQVSFEKTIIMLSAKKAAEMEWNWDKDMSWVDFIDTVLYTFFQDRGIKLKEC